MRIRRRTRWPVLAMIPASVTLLSGAPATAGTGIARTSHLAHSAAAKVRTVIIEGLRYRPRITVVRRGEPVKWVNEDPVPHTVTAVGGSFDSHGIAPGSSWTYVPEKRGEYDYTCTFHPSMRGRLEVR